MQWQGTNLHFVAATSTDGGYACCSGLCHLINILARDSTRKLSLAVEISEEFYGRLHQGGYIGFEAPALFCLGVVLLLC